MATVLGTFYEPSLKNIIDQQSLKWIFVGGKGGVGKTTVSCCLAIQLSRVRESVLLVSTDPAHSLSDAFGQKFSTEPVLVEGFTNLHAMEFGLGDRKPKFPENPSEEELFFKTMCDAYPDPEVLPGYEEMLGMTMFWSLIRSLKYSVVVFDTAPTGYTRRLICYPLLFEELIDKSSGPIPQLSFFLMRKVLRMFGGEEVDDNMSTIPWREMFGKVTSHLRNPDKTTFVGVCIAEFLSLYETERLMQKLTVYGIDSHNLVVNQLHFSTPRDDQACPFCSSRRTMQIKYMEQIASLYRDMHVTKLPLLGEEVRGVDTLEPFSQHLLHPYIPHTPPPHFPSDDH
ncbi:ATPase ASNA1 homolog isoform X2 [Babylonia areolata]|uniref:ATPase ASNA1 homolog isoform X2 n=1 Tax=Babylonia areolata TaxID=304850 RepID=UPI003FCF6FA7